MTRGREGLEERVTFASALQRRDGGIDPGSGLVGETGFEPATSCSQSCIDPQISDVLAVNWIEFVLLNINGLEIHGKLL